jgi:hypothetical protein
MAMRAGGVARQGKRGAIGENSSAVREWYAGRAEPLQRALDRLTGAERHTLIKSLGQGERRRQARRCGRRASVVFRLRRGHVNASGLDLNWPGRLGTAT